MPALRSKSTKIRFCGPCNVSGVSDSPSERKNRHEQAQSVKVEEILPVYGPENRKVRPSFKTAMSGLAPRQVLLENTYKAHKRSGTHYQYSRFYINPRKGLDDELLTSPRFVRRVWKESSLHPAPVWRAHENYAPFSTSTFSIHALEMEIRLIQDVYVKKRANRAVAKKLLKWAAAVVPPSIEADRRAVETPTYLWRAQTPPGHIADARSMRVRAYHPRAEEGVMSFVCPPPCGRDFPSQRILRIHQERCAKFKAAQAVSDKQASKGGSALERFKSKRRKLNPDPQSPSAASSSAATITEPADVEMPLTGDDFMLLDVPAEEPQRSPTPPPQLTAAGRPIRQRRKTWKLLQQLPERVPSPPPAPAAEPAHEATPEPEAPTWAWKSIFTTVNAFGLFRDYPCIPTYNPDAILTAQELSDIPGTARSNTATIPSGLTPFAPEDGPPANSDPAPPNPAFASQSAEPPSPPALYTGPFANWTTMAMMVWQWTGSATKSVEETEKLVDIMKDPNFKSDDLKDFNLKRETEKFDAHLGKTSTSNVRDGWKTTSVSISVPDGKKHASEADAPVFHVPGLFYRPLVAVIRSAVRDMSHRCMHYTPFRQYWKSSPGSPPQRIRDEIYSSDAMVEAHTALQNQPPEPGCVLERVVLALMFWSDSTHLASFGDASLWPLYLFFGNQSKWLRVKPRSNMCHHVAYFPKLPDSFHDFFRTLTGDAPSADVLTHCRRELMHAIWRLLLDDEFLEAWEHGIVIECEDGVLRRFFPRIFTYSADYPEKVLLATIRNLGKAPCPRCYIPKDEFENLGFFRDDKKRETEARTDELVHNGVLARIRKWIFELGRTVKSKTFDYYLLARSWTPTINAFSERLSKFKFNVFKMFVPDFMHEFELGGFKAWFIH